MPSLYYRRNTVAKWHTYIHCTLRKATSAKVCSARGSFLMSCTNSLPLTCFSISLKARLPENIYILVVWPIYLHNNNIKTCLYICKLKAQCFNKPLLILLLVPFLIQSLSSWLLCQYLRNLFSWPSYTSVIWLRIDSHFLDTYSPSPSLDAAHQLRWFDTDRALSPTCLYFFFLPKASNFLNTPIKHKLNSLKD